MGELCGIARATYIGFAAVHPLEILILLMLCKAGFEALGRCSKEFIAKL